MKLEQLVPPLEMCLKIPQSKFADSALAWQCTMFLSSMPPKHVWEVKPRSECFGNEDAPAPTLEEIMEEMRKDHEQVAVTNRQSGGWCVHGWDFLPEDDKNAATAAIRVFLRSVRK